MKNHYFSLQNWFKLKRKKRLNRNLLLIASTIIIILTPLAIFLARNPRSAEAAWATNFASWAKRQQLNIVNNSVDSLAATTTVAVTVNTKALVDAGRLQSDCDDLRIVYQSGSTSTELSRYISYPGGGTCATSEAAKVHFSLQETLAVSATSSNYYLYYSSPKATAPSDPDNAFDIGSKETLLVCPFDGTTTCAAGETPSTVTGAIRHSGSKSALSFDGFNDSINSGSDTSLDDIPSKGPITVEFWYKPGGSEDSYWTVNKLQPLLRVSGNTSPSLPPLLSAPQTWILAGLKVSAIWKANWMMSNYSTMYQPPNKSNLITTRERCRLVINSPMNHLGYS